MTSLELCRQMRGKEMPKFVRVIKAIPDGRRDYKPDPKSRTALELSGTATAAPRGDQLDGKWHGALGDGSSGSNFDGEFRAIRQ